MSIGVFIWRFTGKKMYKHCVATPWSHIKTSQKFSSTIASLTATISLQKGKFLINECQNSCLPQAALLCIHHKELHKFLFRALNAKWLQVYLSPAEMPMGLINIYFADWCCLLKEHKLAHPAALHGTEHRVPFLTEPIVSIRVCWAGWVII